MAIAIDKRKVRGVVLACNELLKANEFGYGDAIIGLSELIGRIIVDKSGTSIQAEELRQVVIDHITATINAGAEAAGKVVVARA
jgi:hypothetical protein